MKATRSGCYEIPVRSDTSRAWWVLKILGAHPDDSKGPISPRTAKEKCDDFGVAGEVSLRTGPLSRETEPAAPNHDVDITQYTKDRYGRGYYRCHRCLKWLDREAWAKPCVP